MAKKKSVAKKKTPVKKKTAVKKKAAPKKKTIVKKKAASKKKAVNENTNLTRDAAIPATLIIQSCAPGRRCKQKADGNFICQRFVSGRWQQVGGTVFPTLESCKAACCPT